MLGFCQRGIIQLPILIVLAAILLFLIVSSNAPLKDTLLGSLYHKDQSYASEALPSDLNDDGKVNVSDLSILLSKWNINDSKADLNKDGKVGVADFSIMLTDWNKTTPLQSGQPAASVQATQSPSPQASASQTMVEGVPVCTDHDNTKWHGVVKRNADGSINCTYTHDHKSDPRTLDDVFGPVGQYTGGQEISYPWQTHSALGPENVAKHRVYDWEVVRVNSCKPSFAPLGFDAIRREVHADGNSGATVRFHSYYVQARTCDPKDPNYHGKIYIGGHYDSGMLLLDGFTGDPNGHVPLAGDPPSPLFFGGNRRLHMSIFPSQRNGDFTWYHGNCAVVNPNGVCIRYGGGIRKEDWGPLDPTAPSVSIQKPGLNGSFIEDVHLMTLVIQPWEDTFDGKNDGVINYDGFTDRHGNIVASCSPLGADCIPLKLENIKVGSYQFRADNNGITGTDTNVNAPNGKTLITFPN